MSRYSPNFFIVCTGADASTEEHRFKKTVQVDIKKGE